MGDQERDFRLVEENVIKFRKPRLLDEEDVQTCDCRSSSAEGNLCTNDTTCSNRGTRVECLIGFCSKARCQNMRLQKKQRASLRVIDAGCKGRGLVSNEPIKAGTMLSEYTGEVIPSNEYKRRMEIYAAAGGHFYIMGLPNGEYLDAARYGNHMRYMNHSCTPNAQGELWSVGAESRVAIMALRDIVPNEEIQIDYGWGRAMNETVCACGAPMCRWIIGIKSEYSHALKAMPIGEWRLPTGNDLLANGPSGLIGAWIRVMWVGDKGLNEDEFEFDDDDEMASEDDDDDDDDDDEKGDDNGNSSSGNDNDGKKKKKSKISTVSSSLSPLTPKSKAASMGLSKSAGDGTGGVFDRPQRIRRLMRIDSNAGGTWYTGRIVSYDKSRRIHSVQYSVDGEISEENLLEAIHSGSGCSKEPSFWMILNPARTRAELNSLVQRTAMDPNKMVQYNHKIDPSVAALPKCPAFDLSVTELANLRLVFPDDRRESNINWDAVENKGGNSTNENGNTSPTSLTSSSNLPTNEGSSSSSSSPTVLIPEDDRDYSVFVVPKAVGVSRMLLPSPTAPSSVSISTEISRNPTPKTATPGLTTLSGTSAVTPTHTVTPLPIGISMDTLQKEREKELVRQKQREAAILSAAKQTAQANAQAEEQQREAARIAYQETLANAFREKLEAAKRAAAERIAMGITPTPMTTTTLSSSLSSSSGNKRSREDERKRYEQKQAERKEKKLQKKEKQRKQEKKKQMERKQKSKRSRTDRSSGVKFTPPTTEIIPSSLPLATKGISTYPFIGLPTVTMDTPTDTVMTDTVTLSSLQTSRTDLIQAILTILTGHSTIYPHLDKKEVLGKALLVGIAAPSASVMEASVAAAGIVLVTLGTLGTTPVPDTTVEHIAQIIDQSVDVVRASAEMVTASLPSGSPSLLFASFTFLAGNNAIDLEPFCQPFALLRDAITLLQSALFSSSSPLSTSSAVAAAAVANATALRDRLFATLPSLKHYLPYEFTPSSSLPSIVHYISELLCVWTFTKLPNVWNQVSPRSLAASLVYAAVAIIVPSNHVLPYLSGGTNVNNTLSSYLIQLETYRMKVEYVKSSHVYLQINRWIESLRNLALAKAHTDETRLTLASLVQSLGMEGLVSISPTVEYAVQLLTGSVTITSVASGSTVLLPSASLLTGRSLLPLASVPEIEIVRRTYDFFYGNEQIANIPLSDSNNAVSNGSSSDTNIVLRSMHSQELLTILRLNTNKWDDMANKSHEQRKQARDPKASPSSSSSSSVSSPTAYPSKEKLETASSTLFADDTYFGKEHTKAMFVPSSIPSTGTSPSNHISSSSSSSSSSSDLSIVTPIFYGKVSRHPHFLIPLYLFSDNQDNSSVLGGFEYCPHSLSGFARSQVLIALSFTVRHRIAYQLLRAVGRAEDRNVVLNGLCPSSVLLDASGHVRLDTYSYAQIVTDRHTDKVMMLLGVVPTGTPPNKQKLEPERLTELKNYLQSLGLVDMNIQSTGNWENSSLTKHSLVQLYSLKNKELLNNLSTTTMDITSIAPEILFGFPLPLPISDVWALGMCMAVAYLGESPFPSMQNLMETYIANAPIEVDLGIVKLQARILGAVASIEAIMGPIHSSWSWLTPSTTASITEDKASIVPASAWIRSSLASLRATYPDIAPVGNATTPAEATEALRNRFTSHYGLRSDITDLLVRALTINPAQRPNARELISSSLWKQEIHTYSTSISSITQETNLITAREKLASLLRLGNDTALLSTRSSGSNTSSSSSVNVDNVILSNLPSTRWPSNRNTVNNLYHDDIERYYDNESVDSDSDSDDDDENNDRVLNEENTVDNAVTMNE